MNRPINNGRASHAWHMFALAVLLAVRALVGFENARAQESTNYRIDDLTVVSAAGRADSGRFGAVITFAAATPAGSMSFCNAGFGVSLGYWSSVGDPPVPNRLIVTRDENDVMRTVLSWSGSADRFDVYRSTSPVMVIDPQNLFATTTTCSAVDSDPMTGSIFFYNVTPADD